MLRQPAVHRSRMRGVALCLMAWLVHMPTRSEQLPACREAAVRYAAPTLVPLEQRILVRPLEAGPTPPGQDDRDPHLKPRSPQRTAAFNRVRVPDFSSPGPWVTAIRVFTVTGEPRAWEIEFVDHGNNPVEPQWLNEELLFLRVWWGRMVSTDLIFQLGSGRFLYAREADYGLLVRPCK